jgi:hypothetical protein
MYRPSKHLSGVKHKYRGCIGGKSAYPRCPQTQHPCGFRAVLRTFIGGIGGKFPTSLKKGKEIEGYEKKRKKKNRKSCVLTPDTPDICAQKRRKPSTHAGSRASGVNIITPDIGPFTPDICDAPPIFPGQTAPERCPS